MATYYIDPVSGLSGNNGTDPSTPKSAYSQLTVSAGDTVLFKCGTTHSGQVVMVDGSSPSARTTYGSYGGGPKPILRHSSHVMIKSIPVNITITGLSLWPTVTANAAGVRIDRATYVTVTGCDFLDGEDGIRSDCVATGSVFNNNIISDNTFRGMSNAGIRIVLGTTTGAESIIGHTTQIVRNKFRNVAKECLLLGTQGANTAESRLHRYHTMTITDNAARDCMNATPSSVNDDQCFSIKNLRETVLGNSVFARNTIRNIGRTSGDSALIVGFWFEGMTNTIVEDCTADTVMTPGSNDGGAFFLDSNTAAGGEFRCEDNVFRRCVALNTNNNKNWVPYTGSQGNNSDGFTISRAAIRNTFIDCIAINCAVGIHVTGNCAVNYFYNCTTAFNGYGWYVQSNSGDTPAGEAQVIRNCISYNNTFSDYEHSTAITPKADEQNNNFGVIVQDTAHATTTRVDPLFVGDPGWNSALAVALGPGSPMIGAGVAVSGVDYDFYGDPWIGTIDKGAIRRDQAWRRNESGQMSAARTRAQIVQRSGGMPGLYPRGV